MGKRIVAFAALGIAMSGLGVVVACSTTATLAGQNEQCFEATDCQEGLVCVPQKSGSSICTSDLSGIVATEDAATPPGAPTTPLPDSGDGAAPPPSDGATPPPTDASKPPVDANQPPPVDANQPPPVDANQPPPVDANQPPPVDANQPPDAAGD